MHSQTHGHETTKLECPYMYINQQDAQNSVIRRYFPLDALHVSDCISPSSGATFISCTSHLVPAYTKCDVEPIKLMLMMD